LTGGLPITIGWGSTKKRTGQPFHLGEKISLEEANALLDFDIRNRFLPALKDIPHWNQMNDNQRGALLSFAYNLGAAFYGGRNFNTITRILRDQKWHEVPKVLEMYRNPGSKVEAGLLRRRKAEGKLWMS
jgi:lysozyme